MSIISTSTPNSFMLRYLKIKGVGGAEGRKVED